MSISPLSYNVLCLENCLFNDETMSLCQTLITRVGQQTRQLGHINYKREWKPMTNGTVDSFTKTASIAVDKHNCKQFSTDFKHNTFSVSFSHSAKPV